MSIFCILELSLLVLSFIKTLVEVLYTFSHTTVNFQFIRQGIETVFYAGQPLMEAAFDGRLPLMKDDIAWKMILMEGIL